MRCDAYLELAFEKLGRIVGTHPIKSLVLSFLVAAACAGGFPLLVNETRPEKQWVPAGSLALEHDEYVKSTWPSNARFNFFIATCRDKPEESCNILEPKYIKRYYELLGKVMEIEVDGASIVANLDKKHKTSDASDPADRPWSKYDQVWSYSGKAVEATGNASGVEWQGRKCFAFGPFCGKRSILDLFRDDSSVIETLNKEEVLRAVNFWEDQENLCPLSIAASNSPCFQEACQKYDTTAERDQCRQLASNYCRSTCPTHTMTTNGRDYTVPVDPETCGDQGCILMGVFAGLQPPPPVGGDNTTNQTAADAPEAAFEFEPFKVTTVVGGGVKDANGLYASGKYLMGYYAINKDEYFLPDDGQQDPVADDWEEQALCVMGISTDPREKSCKEDELLRFTGLFGRSLGDEFGSAIRGDIAMLSSSYFVIILYCAIMIGKRDPVHAGVTLSAIAVVNVGLTILGTFGLMGYIGVPNNNLNSNLYFLILGLGVDDAFVLSSEFTRHTTLSPGLPISERIARTAKTGGISVLITSATDALAFLVGSSTVLPALGWFCTYAGVAIIFCFLVQLFVFLPGLALNARRAELGRLDCLCCAKAEPRPISEPKGCCCCCTCRDNLLREGLKKAAEKATTLLGRIVTLALFAGLAAVGIYGATMIYKDFKLEWFIPDDSYVNQFFALNQEHFATGTPVTVNIRDQPEHFAQQAELHELYQYLKTTKYTDHDVGATSWYEVFMEWAVDDDQVATRGMSFSPSRANPSEAVFENRDDFYTALHAWYRSTAAGRYRSSLRWASAACEEVDGADTAPDGCDPLRGIRASRFNAELALEHTNKGTNRYKTMTVMRQEIGDIYENAFPYSFDFLYWEEVGVIDAELLRNMLICGGVILVIVFLLVPDPRVSIWVVLCIVLSIIDVVGLMYFWDVTISGVSTIYLLICVGLAVDYAAHIAHMFRESTGSARERAVAAVERIGPCTFNAVFSTFLAVVVVGFSKSYIFRVFFKVLFLVTVVSGLHGLWLLPVILSLVGGSRQCVPAEPEAGVGAKESADKPAQELPGTVPGA